MNADSGAAERPGPERPRNFATFYVTTWPGICGLLRSMAGGGDHGVEDVVQEALLIARHRWDDIGRYDRPDLWVIKVAVRMMWRWQRAESRFRGAGEVDEAVDHTADGRFDRIERTADLAAVIATLPPRRRDVINLHYRLDLSVLDIAEVLDMSPGTVKSHLSHGRSAIAARWAEPERGEG